MHLGAFIHRDQVGIEFKGQGNEFAVICGAVTVASSLKRGPLCDLELVPWEQTRRFALTTRCLLKRHVPAWRVPSTNFLNSPRHRMGAARSRSRCSDASAASLKALGRCASTLGSTKITGAHRVCCPQCPQQGTCPEAVPCVRFGRAPDVRLAAPGSAAARSHGRRWPRH